MIVVVFVCMLPFRLYLADSACDGDVECELDLAWWACLALILKYPIYSDLDCTFMLVLTYAALRPPDWTMARATSRPPCDCGQQ